MASKVVHTGPHKYLRHQQKSGSLIWRCVRPGCTHFQREEFMIGQKCMCWRCDGEFVIEKNTLLKKPHCRSCTRHHEKEIIDGAIQESPI